MDAADGLRRSGGELALRAGRPMTFAAPGHVALRGPAAPAKRLALQQAGLALLIVALGALAFTPLAPLVRWAFPAAALGAAGWFALRGKAALYVSFCLWLFILTPMVRRLVDAHVGFSQINVLMLAPYLAAGWSVLFLPRFFLQRNGPAQWPLAGVLAATTYGLLLAMAQERLFAGAFEFMRYAVPPALAGYVIANRSQWRKLAEALEALAWVALPAVSLYGLAQFVRPPIWDVLWLENLGNQTFGEGEPFRIRVFSTLNSPTSLGFYLLPLILIVLCASRRMRAALAALGLACLAVSLVRSAWICLAIGLFVVLSRSSLRLRASVLAVTASVLVLGSLAITAAEVANPRVEKVLTHRLETFTNLGGDKSMSDRTRGYAEFGREILERPWGEGLGIANVAAHNAGASRIIDGGPIEILLSLGVLCGGIYAALFALLAVAAFLHPAPAEHQGLFTAALAVFVAHVVGLASVNTAVGEIGILSWLALALVLASPEPQARPRSTV